MKLLSESNLERVWKDAFGQVWYEGLSDGQWVRLERPPKRRDRRHPERKRVTQPKPPRAWRKHTRSIAVYVAGGVTALGALACITFLAD